MYRNNLLHTGVAQDVLPPPLGLKWKVTFGWSVVSSPAIFGSRLYVGTEAPDSKLYAIDTATGNIIWSFNDPGGVVTLGWDSSPAVATVGGNTVIFAGNDNNIFYAIQDNGAAAAKLWDTVALGIGVAIKSSPALTTVGGTDIVIFGTEGAGVYALVAATGALFPGWVAGPGDPILGGLSFDSPAIFGSTVFIGSTAGNLYGINVATGIQLAWSPVLLGVPVRSSPAVAQVGAVTLVFVGALNSMHAVNAATGVVQWAFLTGAAVRSSPAVATIPNPPLACTPGPTLAVIFGSGDGNAYAVRAADGVPCWTFPSTGLVPFHSSPTVSGQTVYIGSFDDNMYAIDINTGSWQWSFPSTSPIGDALVAPNPVVSGSTLYFGTNNPDNKLYAFQAVAPTTVTSTVTSAVTSTVTSAVTSTVTTTIAATTVTTTVTSMETTTSMVTQTVSICPGPSPVPGFPIESILAGLVAGVAALGFLRHRHRRREARGSED
jgi:outer membrane protein assembly factor BamB